MNSPVVFGSSHRQSASQTFLRCAIATALACMMAASSWAAEPQAGWRPLFNGKDLAGWRSVRRDAPPASGWVVEDGWLHCLGKDGGDIITTVEFRDFELEWDWRIASGGNSGMKYFVAESRGASIGHEYQMIDDERHPDAMIADGKHLTGGFYDVLKPVNAKPNPPGEVNHSRVVVRGNRVEHWLNGAKVLEYECASEALRDAVLKSKFKNTPAFGHKVKGRILLQDHHSEVWFRNLRIHESPGK